MPVHYLAVHPYLLHRNRGLTFISARVLLDKIAPLPITTSECNECALLQEYLSIIRVLSINK